MFVKKFLSVFAITFIFMFAPTNCNSYENFSSALNKVYAATNAQLAKQKLDEGNKLVNEEDFQGAISKYTEAIKINPNYNVAYHNRATVYNELKIYNKAIDNYAKIITIVDLII